MIGHLIFSDLNLGRGAGSRRSGPGDCGAAAGHGVRREWLQEGRLPHQQQRIRGRSQLDNVSHGGPGLFGTLRAAGVGINYCWISVVLKVITHRNVVLKTFLDNKTLI